MHLIIPKIQNVFQLGFLHQETAIFIKPNKCKKNYRTLKHCFESLDTGRKNWNFKISISGNHKNFNTATALQNSFKDFLTNKFEVAECLLYFFSNLANFLGTRM